MRRRIFAALAGAGIFAGLLFVGPAAGAAPTKSGPLPNASLTPGSSDQRVTQETVVEGVVDAAVPCPMS